MLFTLELLTLDFISINEKRDNSKVKFGKDRLITNPVLRLLQMEHVYLPATCSSIKKEIKLRVIWSVRMRIVSKKQLILFFNSTRHEKALNMNLESEQLMNKTHETVLIIVIILEITIINEAR